VEGAFVEGAFVEGVCGGRLQNAPTQHTTKAIDNQGNQLCQRS